MATESSKLRFANLIFRGLSRRDLLRDQPGLRQIVTVNAEIIVLANRDRKLRKIINRNWATLDGQWPYLLARWKSGNRGIEKISGSDFIYDLCKFATLRDLRVFLLGGSEDVNQAACERLHSQFGANVDGFAPPICAFPFPGQVDKEMIKAIESVRPAILIVCLGSPKQELWMDSHRRELAAAGVRWMIGAGGTLDFVSGNLKRAPVILQRAGLEFFWRFALQPKTRLSRVLRAVQFVRYAW